MREFKQASDWDGQNGRSSIAGEIVCRLAGYLFWKYNMYSSI